MFFPFSKFGVTVNLFTFVGEIFSSLWLTIEDVNVERQPPVQTPGNVGAHNWNLGRIAWNSDRIAIPDQGVGKFL
ncbi:MAG: hypothetical protein D6790_19775 [Caldilineae bacterium]|nr:MAG: hypothetical protein D6790_19775 [Caldilineae bacterium]